MAKIKFEFWKDPVKYKKLSGCYLIDGVQIFNRVSMFGRSTFDISCPCCNTITTAFVWSFSGTGKRCNGCNIMLGYSGAILMEIETDKTVQVTNTEIIINRANSPQKK